MFRPVMKDIFLSEGQSFTYNSTLNRQTKTKNQSKSEVFQISKLNRSTNVLLIHTNSNYARNDFERFVATQLESKIVTAFRVTNEPRHNSFIKFKGCPWTAQRCHDIALRQFGIGSQIQLVHRKLLTGIISCRASVLP